MFFICEETSQLICPKCIALNIIILSTKVKKKKNTKNDKKQQQPHYSTLISLLKDNSQIKDENRYDFLNGKNIEEEKKEIIYKYAHFKEIIIDEKEKKYLDIIYNFIIDLCNLKKKANEISKENKNYLSKYFFKNIKYISLFDIIKNIFINNFCSINTGLIVEKDLNVAIKSLYNYYKEKIENNTFINKLILNNKNDNAIKYIYEQESIISHMLYFSFEVNDNEKEKYLIISSNNGLINILDGNNYKSLYIIDIFQKKGIYNLIQSKTEKNIFFASSWGCFKKIKLFKAKSEGSNIITINHKIIKSYKKSDIIRILKLIEISKYSNNLADIISLDEGGHIIAWGYNEEYKKDTKEEIFVAEREDSINNMILFISNTLKNMLIFTTRNSTLLGSIYFFNIEGDFYLLKCMNNKFKSKIITFDLQYNTLSQINDYMIAFPQNKKIILIDVKNYQISTIIEMETDLIKDKFYNTYGETIGIVNYTYNLNRYFLIISSKGYIFEYYMNHKNFREIIFIGKFKCDFKEEIESIINSEDYRKEFEINLNKEKLFLKFNKKILLIDLNTNK